MDTIIRKTSDLIFEVFGDPDSVSILVNMYAQPFASMHLILTKEEAKKLAGAIRKIVGKPRGVRNRNNRGL